MFIFLYGEDTYYSHKKLKELKEKFIREVDPSAINLMLLDEKNTPADLRTAILTPPFLARKRMIVISDLGGLSSEAQEELVSLVGKKISEDIILIIRGLGAEKELGLPEEFFKKLKASKYSEEFKLLRGRYLERAVQQLATENQVKLSLGGLRLLLALTQGDLWQIENELKKLNVFSSGQPVKEEDILKLVSGDFDENIFHLLDAVGAGDAKQTMALFENQIQAGIAPLLLLNRLTGYLRQLLAVKFFLERGGQTSEISRRLGLHSFVAEKISRQIGKWSLPKLKESYRRILQVEHKSKTGQGNPIVLISIFLTELSAS